MLVVLQILMGLLLLAGGFCLFMMWRNNCVYEFRMRLLEVMVPGEDDYWELSEEFKSVKYETMLNRFWRPLPSFYKGTRLLAKYEWHYYAKVADPKALLKP